MSDMISKSEYGKALGFKIKTIKAKIGNCPNRFLAQSVINDWESEIEGLYDALMLLDKAHTVDAVEIVHGHWIPIKCETGVEAFGVKEMTVEGFKCSVCGEEIDVSEGHFNFCPNCGAKIDEVSE